MGESASQRIGLGIELALDALGDGLASFLDHGIGR